MAETQIKQDQAGVPAGGTTGQGLIKNSNTDFDYSWANLPSGPINPGDITTGSFTDIGDGTVPGTGSVITIHYLKAGNFYFGFNAWLAPTGQVNMVLGPVAATTNPVDPSMTDTINRICFKLGITEVQRYVGYIYGSGSGRVIAAWNTGAVSWSQGNPNETSFVIGILAA